MNHLQQFLTHGWTVFDRDERIAAWVQSALPVCREAVVSPEHARWYRHDNTWFVGVNALDNKTDGSVHGGVPLSGPFAPVVEQAMGLTDIDWDQAQVSVCYPGYPRFSNDEPEAAHRYRMKRDAAHIDGLNRVGSARRRHLLEQHAFILGIPMVETSPEASPFVVWQGSHRIAKATFDSVYSEVPPGKWSGIDTTDTYQALRQEIFECCERITLPVLPGQCFLAHRHVLHGMAPWGEQATAGPDGRMICYFRPELHNPRDWLSRP